MSRLPRFALLPGLLAGTLALAACGGAQDSSEPSGTAAPEGKTVEIGITQIVTHPSLDAAREGFKKAIADGGIKAEYEEQNAQGDQATATSIATKFAKKDLVLAIATPTAQAAAQAITDVPVMITAVTDPVKAGLVDSLEKPGGNITGTTDLNPVEEQLKLIKEIAPDAKTVGIVYSSGEVNSQVQVDLATKAAPALGLTIKPVTVTNSAEVQQAANSLDVDAIFVPTDNTVVSSIESLLQAAATAKIPVVTAEGDSVKRGGMATYGIDYEKLGYQTGEMAVKVLGGADPATMPIERQEELQLIVNPKAAKAAGVTLPEALVSRADTVIE
ncbi:ABC transporter substrate-binding protein [Gephyromycinifex aptenodytis]|uniref:ABC transporter substrate-binding protein n=1 Tax=Gephyromycinifex aptenodytis TaxID=2716227 RepID=UPI001448709D|nr:ABC transporter substrate-binding protein [Gephyromycinifex aptenodytis]